MQAIGDLYNGIRNAIASVMLVPLDWLYHQLSILGIPSWGLTIILFTVAIKILFTPLTIQQLRASRAMQALQPQLNDLKKLHGKDRESLMKEQMRLYKENRVNPTAGCLPMLIQMPIWIGLYQALFLLQNTSDFAARFLWIPSLAEPEPIPYALVLMTAASQWVVQRMMQVNVTDPQQKQMNQAMQFMPLMYLFISFRMPAGLVLYWVASNVFTMIQQSFYFGWKGVLPTMPWAPAKVTEPAPRPRREPVSPPPVVALRSPVPPNGTVARLDNGTNTAPRRTKKRRK